MKPSTPWGPNQISVFHFISFQTPKTVPVSQSCFNKEPTSDPIAALQLIQLVGRVNRKRPIYAQTAQARAERATVSEPSSSGVSTNSRAHAHNELECHWGHREGSSVPLISCTLISDNNRGNANIYDGSNMFKADQMGRMLDVKIPPFEKCQVEIRNDRAIIRQPGDLIPRGLRSLKEHVFAFQYEGQTIEASGVTSWWVPYDLGAIMRNGDSLNTDIPADINEAEFPP
jgi:hypothetical protein